MSGLEIPPTFFSKFITGVNPAKALVLKSEHSLVLKKRVSCKILTIIFAQNCKAFFCLYFLAFQSGLHWVFGYVDRIPCRPISKKTWCPLYDSKQQMMVRLKFRRSKEYGEPLHSHYTQVRSDLE